MSNPFQDQFIKAGLVNKKQVNQAKIDQRKMAKEQRQKNGGIVGNSALEQALKNKKEQARQSNAQRDLAAREKEVAAQIKQMVSSNRLKVGKGDIAFHFADANKIKKMCLPKATIDQLSTGGLGIVKVEERYEIVPAETAGKIRDRCPEALIVWHTGPTDAPDDPYKEFPIPDDYEW